VTADIPRQATERDRHINTLRDLVSQGVFTPNHPRWPDLEAEATALNTTPASAIYRVRDGCWSDHHHDFAATAADFIRKATP
jgi:hypothetical protein